MYKLSVGALFKNEAHCINEWIEHYLNRGVEHFYLINDNSNDNFLEKIQQYIDSNIVTLFHAQFDYYVGRQRDMYNRYILPNIKETKWLLIVDLDEFMWCPRDKKLIFVLEQGNHLGQIQVNHTLFGSNGHIEQPETIVKSFTKRTTNFESDYPIGNCKYFINTDFDFVSLNVHHATFSNEKYNSDGNVFIYLGPEYFILNHYSCQSFNFWKDIKCTRGDGDNYFQRTIDDFHKYDINEVEDFGLIKQNESN
jgi:hypothetical protein